MIDPISKPHLKRGKNVANCHLPMLCQLIQSYSVLSGDSSNNLEFRHNGELAKAITDTLQHPKIHRGVSIAVQVTFTPWQLYDSYINERLESMVCK